MGKFRWAAILPFAWIGWAGTASAAPCGSFTDVDSAFAERFARTLGVPPTTYLTRWRMLVAAQRLCETSLSIARIAVEVGYESESTFTRAFTRERGMGPGAYRRGATA